MKFISKFRMLAMLVVALMAIGTRAEAQGFGFSVSLLGSPNPVGLNSNLTYTINLTNSPLSAPNVIVTNTLDVQSTFVSATNTYPGVSTTNFGNVVVFDLGQFIISGVAHMTVIVRPTGTGFITNTVTINFVNLTNFSTNIVIQVTNTVSPTQADLAVAIAGPPSAVFTNDWMTYGVNVTNLGPASASNVMLTNTLPPGVRYITNSLAFTRQGSGSNVVFSLGTLASNAFLNFILTVQPTNAGGLTFSSFVNSTSVADPNPTNNTATNNITVTNYFSGQLVAYTNSAQVPNGQVGYLEQVITVSNAGPTGVAAVRLVVSGLTNRLANAVGMNNGNPFVVYGSALDTNQSVNLLLQFSPNRTPFAFSNSQLHPFAVAAPNLTPPPETAVSTNVSILGIFPMPSGGMLLEFPSLTNRTYTVVYSTNLLSTNWLAAQPSIVAPANYTFWIDYGPPATLSQPAKSPMRFYRVVLNP